MKEPAISFGSTPKCNCERLTGHRSGSLACRGFKLWNLRRRVGPQQYPRIELRRSVEVTEARSARASRGGVEAGVGRPDRFARPRRRVDRCRPAPGLQAGGNPHRRVRRARGNRLGPGCALLGGVDWAKVALRVISTPGDEKTLQTGRAGLRPVGACLQILASAVGLAGSAAGVTQGLPGLAVGTAGRDPVAHLLYSPPHATPGKIV
jgi:hypothetical protein